MNTFHALSKLLFQPEKKFKINFCSFLNFICINSISWLLQRPLCITNQSNTAHFHTNTIFIIQILSRQQLVTGIKISLFYSLNNLFSNFVQFPTLSENFLWNMVLRHGMNLFVNNQNSTVQILSNELYFLASYNILGKREQPVKIITKKRFLHSLWHSTTLLNMPLYKNTGRHFSINLL